MNLVNFVKDYKLGAVACLSMGYSEISQHTLLAAFLKSQWQEDTSTIHVTDPVMLVLVLSHSVVQMSLKVLWTV